MTVLNTSLLPREAVAQIRAAQRREEVAARLKEMSFIAGFKIENEAQEALWKAGCSYDQIKKVTELNISVYYHAELIAPIISRV